MACSCGFSTEYPECNGTHKVVSKVRKKIAEDVQELLNKDICSNEDIINLILNKK